MKRFVKTMLISGIMATAVLSFTACSLIESIDVVGNGSVTAFDAVLDAMPDKVAVEDTFNGWSLSAPDDSVKFIWSQDYSKNADYNLLIALDAKPFIAAGLDANKLPANYTVKDNVLLVGTKLGEDTLTYDGTATPIAAYEQIVKLYRSTIGYHMHMDHYGVDLGNGNMFEWAKDMGTNDKDIVYVLSPEPLIAAGVDPAKVEGWAFAKVKVGMGATEKEVDKFLKPFDIKS